MMNNMNRSQVKWGILLIGLGLLFLLSTMGIIDNFSWGVLFHFWPVILIVIGLNIILKKTPLWWLTPVIVVLGILGLFLISSGPGYFDYNYNFDFNFDSPFNNASTYRSETKLDEDIEALNVDLNFSAGRLVVDSVRDETKLYEARLKYRDGSPRFAYHYDKEMKTGYLSIKQPEDGVDWLNFSGRNDWDLYLTEALPLTMTINAGAGDFNFNLDETKIEKLTVNSGAGDMEVDLGSYAHHLVLNAAAANIKLNIPENKAVSIKTAGLISSNNFTEEGLIKVENNLYQTASFENSEDKLRIEINSPASQVDLDFYN